MVKLKTEDDGTIVIHQDSETVGYIHATENTLTQIDVFPEHQQNGYATDALEQFLEQKRANGYNTVRTTAVVSPTFERILVRAGFEPTEEEMANTYEYIF